MTVEFKCCECGQSIVAVVLEIVPEPPLCGMCLNIPGWNDDPHLRDVLAHGARVRGAAQPLKVNGHPVHHWAGRKARDASRRRWKLVSSRSRWYRNHGQYLNGLISA